MDTVPIVRLTEAEPILVAPSAGWNASATAQDKVRWATLYAWLLRKGASEREASSIASMKMFQHQMPHMKYGRTQELMMKRWLA